MSDAGIDWEAVAKGVLHPLRMELMRVFAANPEERFSPKQLVGICIERGLDAPLGNVSYHVRQLHGLGFIRPAGKAPRRGAVEHYYRATLTLLANGGKRVNGAGFEGFVTGRMVRERVRRAITERDLTPAEAAAEIGISVPTLKRVIDPRYADPRQQTRDKLEAWVG